MEQCSYGFPGLGRNHDGPNNYPQSEPHCAHAAVSREMCVHSKIVRNCHEAVSAELIQRLRSSVLAPLSKPTKAQVQEELELIASLSVTIDLIAQGWRIITISPAVVIEFTNGLSPEAEKERIRHVHLIDRDDQLRQPATRAFIKGMETKRLTQKGMALYLFGHAER